ncbi:MAG: hypothetical protein ABIG28_00260 [archaeon]
MVNKKAQDLSIGTLILIVLGIIVLVLLILGFSMGWSNLWEKIGIFGGSSSVGDVGTACKLAITSQDTYTFCQKTWKIDADTNGDGKIEKDVPLTCRHELVKPSLGGDELPCGGTTELKTCPANKLKYPDTSDNCAAEQIKIGGDYIESQRGQCCSTD